MAPVRSILALALLLGLPASAAAAPVVTEHGALPSKPTDVAAGPDGATWVALYDGPAGVARISPSGVVTTYTAGFSRGKLTGIAAGPDGNLWVTAKDGDGGVYKVTPQGVATMYQTPTKPSKPEGIAAGPDGAMWFTEEDGGGRIGRVDVATGAITEFPTPGSNDAPREIAAGPDGALWFTQYANPGGIGRITTDGTVTTFPLPVADRNPNGIAAGPDGALWFTEYADPGAIGRITTDGTVTRQPVPTANRGPWAIATGTDGALYFTGNKNAGLVGRVTTDWVFSSFTTGVSPDVVQGVAVGGDGNTWYAANGALKAGRVTVAPGLRAIAAAAATQTTVALQADIRPNGQPTTYTFEYGTTPSYGKQVTASAGEAGTWGQVVAPLTGLEPDTTYHFRVTATNDAGQSTSADHTFKTFAQPDVGGGDPGAGPDEGDEDRTPAEPQPDPVVPAPPAPEPLAPPAPGPQLPDPGVAPAPQPEAGKSVVLEALQGTVKVRDAGGRMRPLTGTAGVPAGAVVDARHGMLELTSAVGDGTQTGRFWGGVFQVRQARDGMTELVLRGALRCGKAARAAAAKRKRRLWGSDSHGKFRTRGRGSVATVRGTRWLTEDRCDGTLTRVTEGAVAVRDLKRKRTVLVKAGRSLLVRR